MNGVAERIDVAAWRMRQLHSAGFPAQLARSVAALRGYDLHALIELAERGCPPELAVRILAPLDVDERPC
jgi:hypothetical protein